jgi:hypothetical protein
MTNPFIPNTVGGRAGDFAYEDITREKQREEESLSNIPTAPGNPNAPFKTSADYEAEDREKVENYTTVIVPLDNEALSKLEIVNQKKQEIADIMTEAFAEVDTLSPYPTAISGKQLIALPDSVSDSDAEKVSYMAGISTFLYPSACNPDPPSDTGCDVGIDCCLIGVSAPIYSDIVGAWHYPNLESESAGKPFYSVGEKYIRVTDSNVGIGVTAYEFGNVEGATEFVGIVTTQGDLLGSYYFWPDIDVVRPGSASLITSLVNDIETLRTEINDIFVGEDGSNIIRKDKTFHQINLWYEKKGQLGSGINYQRSLNSLENNQNNIQEYDG